MKKSIAALALVTSLAGAMPSALAQVGSEPAAFVFSFSLGEGAVFNPNTNERVTRSTSGSPLALELIGGFHLSPWATLDAGFLFAYDVFEPYHGHAKSYYAGFRPGVHLYGGSGGDGLRPYFRGAFPITYDDATGTVAVGVLLGFGLEVKTKVVGFFGEIDVSPYFNNDNLILIEFRLGLAFHF